MCRPQNHNSPSSGYIPGSLQRDLSNRRAIHTMRAGAEGFSRFVTTEWAAACTCFFKSAAAATAGSAVLSSKDTAVDCNNRFCSDSRFRLPFCRTSLPRRRSGTENSKDGCIDPNEASPGVPKEKDRSSSVGCSSTAFEPMHSKHNRWGLWCSQILARRRIGGRKGRG